MVAGGNDVFKIDAFVQYQIVEIIIGIRRPADLHTIGPNGNGGDVFLGCYVDFVFFPLVNPRHGDPPQLHPAWSIRRATKTLVASAKRQIFAIGRTIKYYIHRRGVDGMGKADPKLEAVGGVGLKWA